ncbi:PepSY-associated TM helix domain-containing protein [Vreelandella utahensis]|uniref:PepSY-associated TM helix domain-containing protein n=1 Tax=Vreelandella halophila TaxID=86177 RepID=UPI001C4E2343|nr:PepSY-associated TM helix domain-containing protein [Halomonas utahensis]
MSKRIPRPGKAADNDAPKGGFRQSMAWLHTWAGLTLGWLLFLMFLTGTAGYFDTEIDRWMQPELPRAQTDLEATDTARVLLARLEKEAPEAERWFLRLPTGRNQPYPEVFWQGASVDAGASAASDSLQLNGKTGETFQARDTGGGQLLYQMHWRLHYLSRTQSDVIVGFATLFMLVALISGVIIHKKIFKDFFTFRPGKGQRSWLDAHNVLSVLALPFHLMITYSGLVFMAFSYMPLVVAAHYGIDGDARSQFIADVFEPPGLVEAANEPAALVPLTGLIARAERQWGDGRVRSIDIRHPGDRNARIILSENTEQSVASNAGRLVFNGVNGELLHTVPSASSTARGARDLFIGLHEGLFAGPVLRGLYFFSGLLGTGMIATGLLLWAVKRRQRAETAAGSENRGLRLVEKLNVGTIVGLPIGIAAYFWANRLLPVGIDGRADWEVHILFITWATMLLYGTFRPTNRAWIEALSLAATAFALLPLVNALTTDRHLGVSLSQGDLVMAGFDLAMLVIGALWAVIAWRLMRKWFPESSDQRTPRHWFKSQGLVRSTK